MRDTKYVKCQCGWIFFLVPAPASCGNCSRCGGSVELMQLISPYDVPRGSTIEGIKDPGAIWNAEIIQFPVQ